MPATASVRFDAPSFPQIDADVELCASVADPRRPAICLLGKPSASRSRTSRSRGVNGSIVVARRDRRGAAGGHRRSTRPRRDRRLERPRALTFRAATWMLSGRIARTRARSFSAPTSKTSIRLCGPLRDRQVHVQRLPAAQQCRHDTSVRPDPPTAGRADLQATITGWPSNAIKTSPTMTPPQSAGPPGVSPTIEQAAVAIGAAALPFGELNRLTGDSEIPPTRPSMLQYVRRGTPRDGCRYDDTKTANGGSGGNSDDRLLRRRRRRHRRSRRASARSSASTCSIDRRRPVGSGPPMMATMPALAVTDVAPRPCDRDRQVADAEGRVRLPRGGDAEAWRPQDGEARRRIPADQLGIDRLIVVSPHRRVSSPPDRTHHRHHHVVLERDAARRASTSVNLNDRRGRAVDER